MTYVLKKLLKEQIVLSINQKETEEIERPFTMEHVNLYEIYKLFNLTTVRGTAR